MVFLWGSNAREAHPIWFHHLLKGIRHQGTRLYVMDPRRSSSAQWADRWVGLRAGSDIALANAMAREIIHAGLHHTAFIANATEGFDAYRQAVERYTLDFAEVETGIPGDVIREAAHTFATAPRAMICWTLGITEHHNAVDNVLALINLTLLTGQVGRWGAGCNPLRGQNNVQGGGDMGAIPNKLAGFQDIEQDHDARGRFEAAWGTTIQPKYGLNLTQMLHAMSRGELKARLCIGENPAQSDADGHHVEQALRALRHAGVTGPSPAADGGRRQQPSLRHLQAIRAALGRRHRDPPRDARRNRRHAQEPNHVKGNWPEVLGDKRGDIWYGMEALVGDPLYGRYEPDDEVVVCPIRDRPVGRCRAAEGFDNRTITGIKHVAECAGIEKYHAIHSSYSVVA